MLGTWTQGSTRFKFFDTFREVPMKKLTRFHK
jgi:hypothetical protein